MKVQQTTGVEGRSGAGGQKVDDTGEWKSQEGTGEEEGVQRKIGGYWGRGGSIPKENAEVATQYPNHPNGS